MTKPLPGPYVWWVYGDRREFGIDYPTIEEARAAAERYRSNFPHVRYTIRRAKARYEQWGEPPQGLGTYTAEERANLERAYRPRA